jgi:hypothetical protein
LASMDCVAGLPARGSMDMVGLVAGSGPARRM